MEKHHLHLLRLHAPCLTFKLCAADRDSNDFEDHLLPSQRNYTGVLKMRGLPFAATPEDIVYWFNSAGLPIQAITSERCRHCTQTCVVHLYTMFAAMQSYLTKLVLIPIT